MSHVLFSLIGNYRWCEGSLYLEIKATFVVFYVDIPWVPTLPRVAMYIAGQRLGNRKVTGVAPITGGKDVTSWFNVKKLLLEHQEKIDAVTVHKETLSKQGHSRKWQTTIPINPASVSIVRSFIGTEPSRHRGFLCGNRQTKCLGGDHQSTLWCLEEDQLHYLRNGRTKCALTVSYRRPEKLGCSSNSLNFGDAHTSSHVSSELFTTLLRNESMF